MIFSLVKSLPKILVIPITILRRVFGKAFHGFRPLSSRFQWSIGWVYPSRESIVSPTGRRRLFGGQDPKIWGHLGGATAYNVYLIEINQ
jgi:hypothetical protein